MTDNIDANIGPAVRDAFGPILDNPMLSEVIRKPRPRFDGPCEPAKERNIVRITIEVAAPHVPVNPDMEQEDHDDIIRRKMTRDWIEQAIADGGWDCLEIDFE